MEISADPGKLSSMDLRKKPILVLPRRKLCTTWEMAHKLGTQSVQGYPKVAKLSDLLKLFLVIIFKTGHHLSQAFLCQSCDEV